ncbi:unnamed protein product [Cylindrotheca closterium]|uniref:Uncharacterized protein n=1 Tax=Cylindrotheca closterium TaxID=2856 RepID=A0AAD2GAR1_9STRA|nr:unnamed protein product [Cylindrotheca closterium]
MFRKPSKKKKPSKIRKREEEEDDEEDLSLQDKIRSTQKKHKILSSLPLVTGNPSRSSSNKASTEDVTDSENATGEMTVMEKKNHELMQNYIEQKLNSDKPTGSSNPNSDTNTNEDDMKDVAVTDEETLYQQLAKEVYSKRQYDKEQVQEERGAVLVGGTGLAEVILPASHSGKKNKSNQQFKNRVNRKDDSSSAVPALSSMSNAKLHAAPQFRSFQQHHKRAPAAPQEEKDSEIANAGNEKIPGDGDRVGFDAYRGKPTEKKPIVKKQRDDSAFSDFVRHQRDKMMNRR